MRNNNKMIIREALHWKDDISFTCPCCEYQKEYTVYLNVAVIECDKCEEVFDVQLYASDVILEATDVWEQS